MPQSSVETIQQMWIVTLIIYAVVLVVVAVLLTLVLHAARKVRDGVATIWTIGQQVANNTIHIALLDTTNHLAGDILASAKRIVGATAPWEPMPPSVRDVQTASSAGRRGDECVRGAGNPLRHRGG